MEIEVYINKIKDIYSALMDFIDAIDDSDKEFKTLIEKLEKIDFLENQEEVRLLFQLISKIADNHHQISDFFDKIMNFLKYLIKDTPSPISYFIPDYTNYNKIILYLLLDKKYIKPDESFLKQYFQSRTNNIQLYYYIYPIIKEFLDEKIQKQIEEEILQIYQEETISTFAKSVKMVKMIYIFVR